MRRNAPEANKDEPTPGVAQRKALILLERHARQSRGLISFPECRRVLSHLYHFDREEVFAFLTEMEQQGLCTIIPFHGVHFNNRRGGNGK